MGSTDKGLITGFICRLCSKMNRYVILIYGEEGERMGLADKINSYLPITVTRNDPLPKTVCPKCVDRLERHSRMVDMITTAEYKFHHLAYKNSALSQPGESRENHREEEEEDSDGEEDCLLSDEGETRTGTC